MIQMARLAQITQNIRGWRSLALYFVLSAVLLTGGCKDNQRPEPSHELSSTPISRSESEPSSYEQTATITDEHMLEPSQPTDESTDINTISESLETTDGKATAPSTPPIPDGFDPEGAITLQLEFESPVPSQLPAEGERILSYTLHNESSGVLTTGHPVLLFRYIDGDWVEAEGLSTAWNLRSYSLVSGSSETFRFTINMTLPPGFYCLAKGYEVELTRSNSSAGTSASSGDSVDTRWVVSEAFTVADES